MTRPSIRLEKIYFVFLSENYVVFFNENCTFGLGIDTIISKKIISYLIREGVEIDLRYCVNTVIEAP